MVELWAFRSGVFMVEQRSIEQSSPSRREVLSTKLELIYSPLDNYRYRAIRIYCTEQPKALKNRHAGHGSVLHCGDGCSGWTEIQYTHETGDPS